MAAETLEISSILSHLLTMHGISEAELSRKISIPRATINRLVSGRTPDPRASTLEVIADYFHISVDQLIGKKPIYSNASQSVIASSGVSLPIIQWSDARNWGDKINNIKPENHFEWIMVDPSIEKGIFALKVQGESMWPNFQENTILIVDPNKQAKNKNFVIVYIQKNDEVIFRQLITEGKYNFLKAINTMFPIIQIDTTDEIIGVVLQTRSNYE